MENITDADRKAILSTFLRSHGETVRCQNCARILAYEGGPMHRHWKSRCPSLRIFQYNYPEDKNDKMTVTCLACHSKFDNLSVHFMIEHRDACEDAQIFRQPKNKENDGSRLAWPPHRPVTTTIEIDPDDSGSTQSGPLQAQAQAHQNGLTPEDASKSQTSAEPKSDKVNENLLK